MTAAGHSPHRHGVSIGAVLAQLRADFPDVTISKIRFLESEGLVRPQRTAAGYRQFSLTDVERLRYVLTAQRDQYLPLRVIKEQLDAIDRGEHEGPADHCGPQPPRRLAGLAAGSTTAGPAGPTGPTRPEDFADGSTPQAGLAAATDPVRMTQEEVLSAAAIGREALAELERFGLVRPGPAGFYDTDAVLVARTAQAMTEFGLEPRHLRAFRASADREVGLLAQIVTPMSRQRDPDARARADEVVRELAVLSVRLHALLVKTGLRDSIGT